MLKVIFVGHRDLYFGAESVLFRVIRLLKQTETVLPMVILPKSDDHGFSDKLKEESIDDIKFVRYKLIGHGLMRCLICIIYNFIHLLPLYFYYSRRKADAVYTNTSVNITGALLAMMLNKPHTWHWHEQPTAGTFKWIPKGLFPFYRYLIRRRDTDIIFISNTQRKLWEKEFGMKFPNSQVIYTPADEILPEAKLNPARTQAGKPVTFGFLGSWTASKNLLTLLDAFANLRKQHHEQSAKLLLMGGGEMENAILARIIQLNLQDDVQLMKHSTHVAPFFNAIDIFVLPSHFESWGLVVLEAIRQRKAVICTLNSSLTEILTDQKDCLFINPAEISSLEQAMEQMLLHPQSRENMESQACKTLHQLHLNTQFTSGITDLFKRGTVQ